MNSKVSGYGEGSNPAEDHSSKVVKKVSPMCKHVLKATHTQTPQK